MGCNDLPGRITFDKPLCSSIVIEGDRKLFSFFKYTLEKESSTKSN